MFEFTLPSLLLSKRIYTIEYTNIKIKDILWSRQILWAVKFGQYDSLI